MAENVHCFHGYFVSTGRQRSDSSEETRQSTEGFIVTAVTHNHKKTVAIYSHLPIFSMT
jgi:hypothetical protein